METFVEGFASAVGQGFAQGIAAGLLYVLLIALAILAASFLLGGLFALFSIVAYYKRKPKLFLTFAIISDFFLSLLGGILLSAWFAGSPAGVMVLAPLLFIGGIVLSVMKFRALARKSKRWGNYIKE